MRAAPVAVSVNAGSDGALVVDSVATEFVATCGMVESHWWWTRIGCDLLAGDAEPVEPARRLHRGGCRRGARACVRGSRAPSAYRVRAVRGDAVRLAQSADSPIFEGEVNPGERGRRPALSRAC